VFASTPKGKNLFYDTHRTAERTPSEWYSLTLKASESGILPLEELEDLRRTMDPEEFAQEYECSFDAALKGAIYANEVNTLFSDNRIRESLYDPNLPVHVVYDLGFTDATVALWWQEHKDGRLPVVNCDATTGVEIQEHIAKLHAFPGELGTVWLPHDAKARNLQTGRSVVEQFLTEGVRPSIVPVHKVRDRISATRKLFPRVWIDPASTGDLIEALKVYRREWNEEMGMFSDRPLHDWSSNFADAFGYFCVVATAGDKVSTIKDTGDKMGNGDYHLQGLFSDHEMRMGLTARRIS
jgi:hypothetical protein